MSGVAPFLTNAGKASIDGAELELTWAPAPDWLIEASVGYLDATIDELDEHAARHHSARPAWRATGCRSRPSGRGTSASRTPRMRAACVITPRVDASYQDTTFFDATNTREIAQLDDVTTVNAHGADRQRRRPVESHRSA